MTIVLILCFFKNKVFSLSQFIAGIVHFSSKFLEVLGLNDDLNDVPSPYQSGLLDEFLPDPIYCPIIETNRGCPYVCTFCQWGDLGKSDMIIFSQERVVKELEYIVKNNVISEGTEMSSS